MSEEKKTVETSPETTALAAPEVGANPTQGEPLLPEPVRTFPVLPLRNTVVFPHQITPLTVGREMSLKALEAAASSDRAIVLVAQKTSNTNDPSKDDLYTFGTLAEVLKVMRMPDGTQTAIVQGRARAAVLAFIDQKPAYRASIRIEEEGRAPVGVAVEALVQSVRRAYQQVANLAPYLSDEHVVMAHNVEGPGRLADVIVSTLQVDTATKQKMLEISDPTERLEAVNRILNRELKVLELSSKIQTEAQDEITKHQKDYYLRQQLKAIQKELGEGEDDAADVESLREKVRAAGMPADVLKVAEDELKRLGRMNAASPEHAVIRTYIDWLLAIPWATRTDDRLDLESARKVLERDHYDLEKVKKRIVEFLAVRKLKADSRGPILCFVGPPGVGKTSLGRSIAESLGRKFVRVSLGGMRDEAEIRGHRRTYVGALPGRIIQGLKKAGSMNPVFVLDEIDKLGSDFRGDPSSALLEALDPEQNNAFSDHYIEVPVDLSNVLFIATANWLDPIPAALRDRLEIIEIPGYTTEDKVSIAKKHLLPKQVREHGLKPSQFAMSKKAIEKLVDQYTREAGVRTLDRTIAAVVRGVAAEIAEGKADDRTVGEKDLATYLGPRKFFSETAERTKKPGVATGLAWTPVGGEILFIEATRMSGKGGLTLTGSLGDVMKESAQAALSWIRTEADSLGIDPRFLETSDVHVHVPSGATPKDGPSAGVTMVTALVSLLTKKPVKLGLAMTGETTLRGHVLPVGGIKEKVLAAHRAGVRIIVLPERNEVDLIDVPEVVRRQMTFIPVRELSEVLEHALGIKAGDQPKKKGPRRRGTSGGDPRPEAAAKT